MKKIFIKYVENGLLKEEKAIGFDQIQKRLERSLIDLKNAKIVFKNDEIGAYRLAYDAMLQAGLSLILCHGYRPAINGFHKTVVECAKDILGNEYYLLVKRFDQMRKNRNDLIYDISVISENEASDSIKTAEKFIKEVILFIKKGNPQQELELKLKLK